MKNREIRYFLGLVILSLPSSHNNRPRPRPANSFRLLSPTWQTVAFATSTTVAQTVVAQGQRFPRPFYKGRSQEKTHPLRLEFFLLRGPLD